MVRERMWEKDHAFAAFYFNRESPERLSMSETAERVEDEYGKSYSKSSIDRMIDDVEKLLAGGGNLALRTKRSSRN